MILFKCIMKSWKFSWKEEVSDEKIKISKVLLCFKDKESYEKVLVFYKNKVFDESTSLF